MPQLSDLPDISKLKSKDWRINHLYKIVDKKQRLRTFKEFGFQTKIRKAPQRVKQVLKYRQGGVTTGCSIDLFDDTIWTPNTTTMILAHVRKDLPKIFDKVIVAYKHMHPKLKPVLDKGGGSRYELRFPEINSTIFTDIEGRGMTLNRLHISEAAFADPSRIRATLGALVPDGKVTYESTPNGMGNEFYKRWIDPKSARAKLFFPWFIQPEYQLDPSHIKALTSEEEEFIAKVKQHFGHDIHWGQIAWRRVQIEEYGEMFWQEYPEDDATCFLASGGCPVDQMLVSQLMNEVAEPIVEDGPLHVWKSYDRNKRYVIGADVAQGVKSDFSVADVWCVDDCEQVAQYRSNNIKPWDFGAKVEELANMYHAGGRPWAKVGVELNNHGHAVNGYLWNKAMYANLYFSKPETPGWHTNTVTRPKMIDDFIQALEERAIKINSTHTLGECLSLVDNGGKIEATEGEHDDTIIAGAISLQLILTEGTSRVYDDLHRRIRL